MILLVQKFDLICKLSNRLLIGFMSVLYREYFKIGSTLVQVMKTLDLLIADVNLLLELGQFVLDFGFALLKFF